MATTKEYKDYVIEQLSLLDDITYKPMMGEYLLYYKKILFGGIYDDRLLVKIVDNNKKYHMEEAIAYDNAKPMYLVDDIDNNELLKDIVLNTYNGLVKDNIVIREFKKEDLEQVSQIVTRNMIEINSKDYGKEKMVEHAKHFTKEELEKKFYYRTKVWVAELNGEIVGTIGLEADWDKEKDTYWLLTCFIKPENQHQKIGTKLIKELEKYAKSIKAKKIIVPASITGSEFYHKMGYQYRNGKKELNDKNQYMMEKIF